MVTSMSRRLPGAAYRPSRALRDVPAHLDRQHERLGSRGELESRMSPTQLTAGPAPRKRTTGVSLRCQREVCREGLWHLVQSTAGDKMTENPSKTKPIRDCRLSPRDWSISDVPERQCTAYKRNGDRCKNAAIRGGNVCGYHGGNAPAVKAKARLRLEMASDRLARQLLNMTSDPNVADPVKLGAIKDALDRSGLAAKNAVSVEVGITKPWESVFEGVSKVVAGPRDPEATSAELPELDAATESAHDEIVGEIDDDEIDDDLPRFPRATGIGIRRDRGRGDRELCRGPKAAQRGSNRQQVKEHR